jgi:hypothetical protein
MGSQKGTVQNLALCPGCLDAEVVGSRRSWIRSTWWADGGIIDFVMNLKTLRKKIRKLETRLQEGPQKLARMKRKLETMTQAKARKAKMKAAAQAAAARRATKTATPVQKKKRVRTAPPQKKATAPPVRSPAKKVKRKLNLSPERRAQLAAAMKARWAAKRAVAQGKPDRGIAEGNSASPENTQSP